jgi:hypothetical protein
VKKAKVEQIVSPYFSSSSTNLVFSSDEGRTAVMQKCPNYSRDWLSSLILAKNLCSHKMGRAPNPGPKLRHLTEKSTRNSNSTENTTTHLDSLNIGLEHNESPQAPDHLNHVGNHVHCLVPGKVVVGDEKREVMSSGRVF